MKVPIGKFRAGVSRYIRAANSGKEVVLTSRGKAVVRLVPVVEEKIRPTTEDDRDQRLEELRAKLKAALPGVRLGKGRFKLSPPIVKIRPGEKTMSDLVIEGRR